MQYHGDPLLDFTLMRFLDRFVRKNPKQKMSDHGGSLMQRASKLVRSHMKEDTGMYVCICMYVCRPVDNADHGYMLQ